ncbi:MFS transporter [Demequina sp. SYSU T00039]|uniref:MFS transporter n=1 Tax=Demequina lignilytica TaxID=3051663 RepID=A0AAW7M172_9MICO|nr:MULTISPECIES: MFS transporter [unclassified Demequina]MDN4478404.1 MFS transporter [Demequina sp. SYSU T00039-1]MDN4487089.1 MFS transporter [Demequina sp. SYSU T00039]MDN4489800.1 MFS transporter [Demequina sp. SYSU T00068]
MTAPRERGMVAPHLRRARLGVTLLFFTNAVAWANLVPRLPEVRTELGLSYTQFGLAIAMMPVGALTLGLAAAPLIRRFHSGNVATAGAIALAVASALAGVAPTGILFAGALFLAGAFDSLTDVAQNSHGLRVQRGYGRSILNAMHGVWSMGAVVGGLTGGAAAGLGLPLSAHLGVVAALVAIINVAGHRLLMRGPDPRGDVSASTPEAHGSPSDAPAGPGPRGARTSVSGRTWALLVALGIIAMSGTWVEDAGATWGASYLRDELGAIASIAALGFVSLQAMQMVGRLTGDRMVDRWGQRAVARAGAAIGLAGMGTALAFPTVWGTVIGFGAAGFGVATLIPSAMAAADDLPGFKHGSALTYMGWLLRASFLVSPPLVGLIADATGIRYGLMLMPLSAVAVLILARVLPRAAT